MPFQHDSILIKSAYFPKQTYLFTYGGETPSGIWTSNVDIFKFDEKSYRNDDSGHSKSQLEQQSPHTDDSVTKEVPTPHPAFTSLKSISSLTLKKDAHKMFVYNNEIYLFGGSDSLYYSPRNEIYKLSVVERVNDSGDKNEKEITKLKWTEVPDIIGSSKPQGRRLFGLQIVNSMLYVAGGRTAEYRKVTVFSDTWQFNMEKKQWQRLDNLPLPLAGVSLHHDKKKNRLLCFGGVTERGVYSNEMYEFHFTSRQWKRVLSGSQSSSEKHRPEPRERHSAVVDTNTNALLIFGGWGEGGCKNDLWKYDMTEDTWTQLSDGVQGCTKRYGHTSFLLGQKLWIYGGKTGSWRNIDSLTPLEEVTVDASSEATQFGTFYEDAPLSTVSWLDDFLGFKKIEVSVSKKDAEDTEEVSSPPQIVDQDESSQGNDEISLEITSQPVNAIAERLNLTEKTSTLQIAQRRTKRKRTRTRPSNTLAGNTSAESKVDTMLADTTLKLPDANDSLKEESQQLNSSTSNSDSPAPSKAPPRGVPMMGMNQSMMAELAARRAKKNQS